jgi:deoxyhypusine synthase
MAGDGGGGEGGKGKAGCNTEALEGVRDILFKPSEPLDESRHTRIAGADFNDASLGLAGLLSSFASTGFQASHLGDAIDVVNQMVFLPVQRVGLLFFAVRTWNLSNM